MSDQETTYVYENTEVKKTGRVAKKELKSGSVDQLVEITPSDPIVGGWKKWVREAELFEVSAS